MTKRVPLAERMRPESLEDFVGQDSAIGQQSFIPKMIASGRLSSLILWGPPGVGKTTLAILMAKQSNRPFYSLSAVDSGVKQVREILKKAENARFFEKNSPILFIDEIHRFNKAQQDALLKAVEKGTIILIGATTENPSFEVNSALLSRCQLVVLAEHTPEDLLTLMNKALREDEVLSHRKIILKQTNAILKISSGDARKLYNVLEIISDYAIEDEIVVDDDFVEKIIQKNIQSFDKNGDQHYDSISALIKSIRGSDPNAALYYLAKMLNAGEDIKFICRKMIISAAEDIGLANPNALLMANTCFQSVQAVGMPEASIIMAECVCYLALCDKSNASYLGLKKAQKELQTSGQLSTPLHLRNAPTELMKKLGYGKNYKYPHDAEQHFINQQYLPSEISGKIFYEPASNTMEKKYREKLKSLWKNIYNY